MTYCPSTFNYIGWTGTSAGVAPFKNHKGVDASLDEPLGYSFATGYYFDYSGTNSDGKGKVDSRSKNNSYNGASAKIYDGWMSKAWWNDATDKAESWIIEFSTKDVTASHVSMQFTSYGAQTGATGKTRIAGRRTGLRPGICPMTQPGTRSLTMWFRTES